MLKYNFFDINIDGLYDDYYQNMLNLRNIIAQSMDCKPDAKTIVFAVKMFGYGARIVFGRFVPYPNEIPIPVDSRIRKIYFQLT